MGATSNEVVMCSRSSRSPFQKRQQGTCLRSISSAAPCSPWPARPSSSAPLWGSESIESRRTRKTATSPPQKRQQGSGLYADGRDATWSSNSPSPDSALLVACIDEAELDATPQLAANELVSSLPSTLRATSSPRPRASPSQVSSHCRNVNIPPTQSKKPKPRSTKGALSGTLAAEPSAAWLVSRFRRKCHSRNARVARSMQPKPSSAGTVVERLGRCSHTQRETCGHASANNALHISHCFKARPRTHNSISDSMNHAAA
mmetsp:Transcript_86048/g.240574  ORF Transcript_86048/g.240574 Transcript_86048/m.240574 type:complete len:260 (+) Transcript_86048:33-812(+)